MTASRTYVLGWSLGIAAAALIAVVVAVRASHTDRTLPSATSVTNPSSEASEVAHVDAGHFEEPVGDAGSTPDISETAAASAPTPPGPAPCPPEPKIEARAAVKRSPEELLRLAKDEPQALGSASIGSPTRGSLWGGVEMKGSEGILRAGGYGWGTELVVRSIERAVRQVRRCYPGSPDLYVGDIARERGGWLKPHRSHQSGLDADIGYYYRIGPFWYMRATAENLDVARTWALVRALLDGGNVEMIFMDLSIQRLVRDHIKTLPEAEQPPEDLFASPTRKDAMIRHTWGHATHFHVRFVDPAAVELGERIRGIVPRLPKVRRVKPAPRRVGDTRRSRPRIRPAVGLKRLSHPGLRKRR